MPQTVKKILGIDYGTKRIGLALAFVDSKVAVPFGILKNQDKKFIWQKINKIIKQESIDLIVVGMPLALSSNRHLSEQALKTKSFVDWLSSKSKLSVVTFDERLTTRQAKYLTNNKKNKMLDDIAAQLILENYLEKYY